MADIIRMSDYRMGNGNGEPAEKPPEISPPTKNPEIFPTKSPEVNPPQVPPLAPTVDPKAKGVA